MFNITFWKSQIGHKYKVFSKYKVTNSKSNPQNYTYMHMYKEFKTEFYHCRASKKKKKTDTKDGKKSQAAGKVVDQKSSDRVAQKSQGSTKPGHDSTHGGIGKTASAMDRPESHLTEKSESNVEADGK